MGAAAQGNQEREAEMKALKLFGEIFIFLWVTVLSERLLDRISRYGASR